MTYVEVEVSVSVSVDVSVARLVWVGLVAVMVSNTVEVVVGVVLAVTMVLIVRVDVQLDVLVTDEVHEVFCDFAAAARDSAVKARSQTERAGLTNMLVDVQKQDDLPIVWNRLTGRLLGRVGGGPRTSI